MAKEVAATQHKAPYASRTSRPLHAAGTGAFWACRPKTLKTTCRDSAPRLASMRSRAPYIGVPWGSILIPAAFSTTNPKPLLCFAAG